MSEKFKSMTIKIPELLHRKFKMRMFEEGKTIQDEIVRIIEKYLKTNKE